MDWKIGEIKQVNGEWYQCVKSDDTCNGCVGKFQPYSFCNGFKECVGKIFKKLEKVGEPYEHCGKLYQCYKLPMEIEIRLLPNNCNPIGKDNLVEIEIKQNKEDMSNTETLWYGPDKKEAKSLKLSNLKPFSLEAAKQGKPVCTRDGRKARIICFDRNDLYPIVALIECEDGKEIIGAYSKEGQTEIYEIKGTNLMMLPEKKEGWVNIDKRGSGKIAVSSPYSTKEEAIHNDNETTIDTIRICWEE